MFDQLRKTSSDKVGGTLRILLGIIFCMAGVLKIVVPSLGQAFSGQLIAADIPLSGIVLITFPIVETVIGFLLVSGFHARLSAAAAAASMVVATYVHVAVEDPSLFPLQPVEPVGPLVLLGMALYVLWRGGGAWSIDLNEGY
jgi:uncharacterized membrane protein YphA (DoxX/SURF4 family)